MTENKNELLNEPMVKKFKKVYIKTLEHIILS